MKTLNNCYLH